MKSKLNIIRNLKDKEVVYDWTLEDIVESIINKSPLELANYIKAREEYRLNGKSDLYDSIKANNFPCFVPNFTFKDYVKGSNLVSDTGYL